MFLSVLNPSSALVLYNPPWDELPVSSLLMSGWLISLISWFAGIDIGAIDIQVLPEWHCVTFQLLYHYITTPMCIPTSVWLDLSSRGSQLSPFVDFLSTNELFRAGLHACVYHCRRSSKPAYLWTAPKQIQFHYNSIFFGVTDPVPFRYCYNLGNVSEKLWSKHSTTVSQLH